MKKIFLLQLLACFILPMQAQSYESNFAKPLSQVLTDIEQRFGVRLKVEVDTAGKVLPYADFRIRPYSVEETLSNVLAIFDYKYTAQGNKSFKIKAYEYMRRTPDDGRKMLTYLNTLYNNKAEWESRTQCLRSEVRERLQIDAALAQRVPTKPVLSKIRKYDGYTVQNFSIETLPGLYVNGSIYAPARKGKHALVLCPNGHWGGGRYNADEQTRFATLARMGAISVSYDLFAWGESELQFGSAVHRTTVAHIVQIMNGITLLDYMLTRKDVDATRIAANGGSGGGSQVVLLALLDDRFTAACPVVSLASHFDGGCPCESGMPIQLACGGTNNAELMAAFAPKPLCVVSDGKDWTASVPELEMPYLQRIYGFYDAKNKLNNVHLPTEGHDFGPNKRKAVYDFFVQHFALDASKTDESKVHIEAREAMLSFGHKGEKLPANAMRNFNDLERLFNKAADRHAHTMADIERKSKEWVATLALNDAAKEERLRRVLFTHMKAVTEWHNNHPYTLVPAGINPRNGERMSNVHRDVIACSAKPEHIHNDFMAGLRKDLTEAQVDKILDLYTIGKYDFTLKGFKAIVPDMTAEEEKYVIQQLRLAREQAASYKTIKGEMSAIFEIYKDNIENYFNNNGRNWRKMYKTYVDKLKAEKKAQSENK